MHHPRRTCSAGFVADAENLRRWLFEAALPLWWEVGADHSLGGYHERIDFNGSPVKLPRRSRVAARQAFCYSEAGRLGWEGPWRQAGRHALNFLRTRFVTSDGTVLSAVDQEGGVIDSTFDLYSQAFALLACACGHVAVKRGGRLSLQLHHHRAEHWVIVRGTAKVTIGNDIKIVHENELIYIPNRAQHRLENPGKIDLELIEVQTGSYLGEDDIVRVEGDYHRS